MAQHSRFREQDFSRNARGYADRDGGEERYRGPSGERSGEYEGRFAADESGYDALSWSENSVRGERQRSDAWDPSDASGYESRSRGALDVGRRHGAVWGRGVESRGDRGDTGRGYEGDHGRPPRSWDDDRGAAWMTGGGPSAVGARGSRGAYDGSSDNRADQLYRSYSGFEGQLSGRPRGRGDGAPGGGAESAYAGTEREGAGSFRGHGPKGYVRKDERICEDVCEALSQDPHLDARGIEVTVDNGVVTLKGEATSRQMKHRAENCADACSGVKDVENHLRVNRGDDQASTAQSDREPGASHRKESTGTSQESSDIPQS